MCLKLIWIKCAMWTKITKLSTLSYMYWLRIILWNPPSPLALIQLIHSRKLWYNRKILDYVWTMDAKKKLRWYFAWAKCVGNSQKLNVQRRFNYAPRFQSYDKFILRCLWLIWNSVGLLWSILTHMVIYYPVLFAVWHKMQLYLYRILYLNVVWFSSIHRSL